MSCRHALCKEQVARAQHRYRNGGKKSHRYPQAGSPGSLPASLAHSTGLPATTPQLATVTSGLNRHGRGCPSSILLSAAAVFRILLPAHEDSHQDLSRSTWYCLVAGLCAMDPCQNLREDVACEAG